jgi:predicted permease
LSSFSVAALYSETHPEYAAYLYLLVPTNLLFLNPIAFTLMELRKQREGGTGSCWSVGRRVGQGVVLNPVVLMTALGIFANLIFSHSLPPILSGLLQVSSSSGVVGWDGIRT